MSSSDEIEFSIDGYLGSPPQYQKQFSGVKKSDWKRKLLL